MKKAKLENVSPTIGNTMLAAAKVKSDLSEKQITLSDALVLIDSEKVSKFDIHYRYLQGDANNYVKGNIYYSDCLDDDADLTVEKFIEQADNYGSFWLSVWGKTDEDFRMLQIVHDETFEPL